MCVIILFIRDELEQKYKKYEIICKICEEKVSIEKMKQHSYLCRVKFEAQKEMKDVDGEISDMIFEAYMKGKELETRLIIDQYLITRFID